jgi:TPR repeat protein
MSRITRRFSLANMDTIIVAGAMLHTGIGASKDQERAFELYQLAGELGSIQGWKNVVACYTTGEGVPQSLEMARYIADTMLKDQVDESSMV